MEWGLWNGDCRMRIVEWGCRIGIVEWGLKNRDCEMRIVEWGL